MDINRSLYSGSLISLRPIDSEVMGIQREEWVHTSQRDGWFKR